MNRAVKESVDEGKTQWSENNDKQMIVNNFSNFFIFISFPSKTSITSLKEH